MYPMVIATSGKFFSLTAACSRKDQTRRYCVNNVCVGRFVNRPVTTSAGYQVDRGENSLRSNVFRVLETAGKGDVASKIVDICLIALIAASVIAVVLESIPAFEARYRTKLQIFEIITVAAFSVEYFLRLWCSVELSPETMRHPLKARLRYAVSAYAVIDLLAVLPYYLLQLGLFGAMDMRFLRCVRLLRILKLTRYSAALDMIFKTFRENAKALAAAFLILFTVMLLAATGMYYFERESQPVDFGSIPASMWWAFATLTTVGYGDVTPITVGGKVFGALITVVGLGMVALPTGILASGYSRLMDENAASYRRKADEAYEDGILSDQEKNDLESMRIGLGLSEHTASQILDARRVQHMLKRSSDSSFCPHCRQSLP